MVTSVTTLGRNGVADWLVQRVSAVVLLAYLLFLAGFLLVSPDLSFVEWRGLFAQGWMKAFSLLALLALCGHAWVGLWTIATDYLTTRMLGRAATGLRLLFQMLCLLALAVYFIWCIDILWSI